MASACSTVRAIGDYAFNDCERLKTIDVSPSNSYYKDIDGILFTDHARMLTEEEIEALME